MKDIRELFYHKLNCVIVSRNTVNVCNFPHIYFRDIGNLVMSA